MSNSQKSTTRTVPDSDAEFLGWQEIYLGPPTALYIITVANHPSLGSSVSKDTMRGFNLRIPPTTDPPVRLQRLS
jgi:hypothetical protein